ncbi:Uncharacterised protein [Streptococcus pneumoniae]|nr:Uncharacterised protein [Streptococcus pneumoniae]
MIQKLHEEMTNIPSIKGKSYIRIEMSSKQKELIGFSALVNGSM